MIKRQTVMAFAVTALLVSGVTAFAAADRPDSWLTAKTKIALLTTEGVDTWDLNVDTVNGVVTLHGKVATEGAKSKADMTAKGIDGVKSVKNLLQVVPKPQRDAVEEKDDAIKANIDKAFKADADIDKSGMKVASVNNGVVLLSGSANSIVIHLKAIETAYKVAGVKRVSSEVKVAETN